MQAPAHTFSVTLPTSIHLSPAQRKVRRTYELLKAVKMIHRITLPACDLSGREVIEIKPRGSEEGEEIELEEEEGRGQKRQLSLLDF